MVPAVKVWFHRSRSIVWALSLIPAILWWQESILFVIIASVYNNVVSDWAASEAADDSAVIQRLDDLEAKLSRIVEGSGNAEETS